MKKKITILVFVLMLATNLVEAQDDTAKLNYNLGLGLSQIIGSDFKSPPNIGNISLKLYKNKSIIRTGLDFTFSGDKNYFMSTYVINAGYERTLLKGKFKMLYGVDAGFRNTYSFLKPDSDEYPGTYSRNAIGLGPIIGFRYEISKKFNIESETGFFFGPRNKKRDGKIYDTDIFWTFHRFISLIVYYKF